ncbi:Uncharacterised protein [Sphingobacterium thalpophilum]|uniref:Uncharacterized protein n=1 Tax=Sphingobacterium thalpophilum TaxID=259 RepID=A0A4U9W5N6_9SPHI|nr:Uncharacterised protein [Sphingobacterium thalpophilum]
MLAISVFNQFHKETQTAATADRICLYEYQKRSLVNQRQPAATENSYFRKKHGFYKTFAAYFSLFR